MTRLEEIYNEWLNNPIFRQAFKTNPEKAIAEAGFIISAEDLKKIRALTDKKGASNEALDDRVSK